MKTTYTPNDKPGRAVAIFFPVAYSLGFLSGVWLVGIAG